MNERVEAKILESIDRREIISLTKKLIGFRTVNPPGNELPCARFIAEKLREFGLNSRLQIIGTSRGNAIGISQPRKRGRTLLLEGHIDTAPIGDIERRYWKTNPFVAKVENGRMLGKGIVDMKGGLAAVLGATKAVLDSGVKLRGNLEVAAFADEEGLMRGIKQFIRSHGADRIDACISTEPMWGVQTVIGGRTWGKITVIGKSTTSGVDPIFALRSGYGNNAIHKAAILLDELRKNGPSYPRNKLFRKSWWQVLKIEGGWNPENAPMCPDTCTLTLEGRLVPGHNVETFWREVRGIIVGLERKVPGFRAYLEVLERRPAYSTPMNHPVVLALRGAYRTVLRREPLLNPFGYPMNSTTDTNYLAAHGIPCVSIGPVEPGRVVAHEMFVANESVSIQRIVDTCKIVALASSRYLS